MSPFAAHSGLSEQNPRSAEGTAGSHITGDPTGVRGAWIGFVVGDVLGVETGATVQQDR